MSRHGGGAKGVAACGHGGTFVTANLVLCDFRWRDSTPRFPAPPPEDLHNCSHKRKWTAPDGLTSCESCGKIFADSCTHPPAYVLTGSISCKCRRCGKVLPR